MSFVQVDIGEFDRLTFLAHVTAKLNRIEAVATTRGEHYAAGALRKLLTELRGHIREGADAAISDPAAIRAQFEADAAAEAEKPENSPLVKWALGPIDDDPPACKGCGAMAGVCVDYPKCPGGSL